MLTMTLVELKEMPINLVMQKQLVLSKILNFLPLKDLKATRQVNHLWKDESQKYFKLRALVKFMCESAFANKKLDECLESRNSSQCQDNFCIRHHLFKGPSNAGQREKTFQEKVEQLIQFHGTNIRSLDLNLSMDATTNFKFLTNLLKNVPQLKELDLHMWFFINEAISKEDWTSDFIIEPLVHLKKFKLQSNNYTLEDYIPNFRKFMRKLLQLTQNVEALDLHSKPKYDTLYLDELKEMQMEWNESKGPMPFKNLSSIEIRGSLINQLFKLSFPIRKLSIYSYCYDLKEAPLQKLLMKHAKTLETLQIEYSICFEERNGLVKNFEFPNLPKLKSLEVNVYEPTNNDISHPSLPRMRLAVESGMLSFGLLESFMMGEQRLKEKFPLLKSLTWKTYNCGFNPLVYEKILPKPNQEADLCFPQFTSFNISGPPTHNVYCSQEEYNEWIIWLAKLFPNVHNPQFNIARLSSSQ